MICKNYQGCAALPLDPAGVTSPSRPSATYLCIRYVILSPSGASLGRHWVGYKSHTENSSWSLLLLHLYRCKCNLRRKISRVSKSEEGVRSSQSNPLLVRQQCMLLSYYQLPVSSSTRVLDKELDRPKKLGWHNPTCKRSCLAKRRPSYRRTATTK